MKQCNISIIMPTYNSAKTVKNSVRSALRQTITDAEIICVDDGSTDDTFKILKSMEAEHSEIKVLQQNHAGSGPARNLGIKSAKGKYIAFLDSDDEYVEADALEKMVNASMENGAQICGSNRIVSENGVDRDVELFKEFNISREGDFIEFADYQDDFHYHSFIFDRRFLIDNDICFPDLMRYQDPPFFLKAMSAAGRFYVLPVVLYRYRQDDNRADVINKNTDSILEGMLETLQISYEHGYEKLFEKIIRRLNEDYRDAVLRNLSDKTMSLLIEINKIARDFETGNNTINEQIYKDIKELPDFYRVHQNLCKSHHYLERIVQISQHNGALRHYFSNIGVESVAVYGVGKFGKILINELLRSEIDIVCCIDRNEESYHGITIKRPEEVIPPCDLLIISLLYPDEVMEQMSGRYEGRIKTFIEIIDEISEEYFIFR